MTIGEKIKNLRKKKNLTQKELGIVSKTSERTIQQYEHGKRQPRIEQLEKIAVALDVTTSFFLNENARTIQEIDTDFESIVKIFNNLNDDYKHLLIASGKVLIDISNTTDTIPEEKTTREKAIEEYETMERINQLNTIENNYIKKLLLELTKEHE